MKTIYRLLESSDFMEISVSILNSGDRVSDVKKLNNTSCDYIHIDVMDGIFVPPLEFSIPEVMDIINNSNKKIDIHLMCDNPISYVRELVGYDIHNITIHREISNDINEVIEVIKKHNIKVGMSIKPNTDIKEIMDYLDYLDLILIMSVEPGYGGQSFIMSSLDKVRELRRIINDRNLDIKIEIDGGVNDTNIALIKDAGVDISVVGSYITKSDNFEKCIEKLQ